LSAIMPTHAVRRPTPRSPEPDPCRSA
jgi:hypothetical protein